MKMKKVKFEKKLRLKKETVANLNNTEMNVVNGGILYVSSRLKQCDTCTCGTSGGC